MIKYLFTIAISSLCLTASAQSADDSGISAGFFDSSQEKDISFSEFKLPPLAVLFENAKSNPNILQIAKQQEIAQAEVAKQKKHIFSYVSGNASASYGLTDIWSGSQGTGYGSGMVWQPHSSEQSFWNVGINVSVPLEDILDLGPSVKRKRLEVENIQIQKDIAYDQLKLQIVSLYIKITNNLVALKSAGESAAAYQGASSLNEVEFHHGNMEIEAYAHTGQQGMSAVSTYQSLLTDITTDIVTLEILTHTPIITNTTTDITLDSTVEKSRRQIAKENRTVEKRIKKAAEEEVKREKEILKQEEKEAKQAEKDAAKAAKEKNK
ncbi:Outer membrane efflux protein [Prevotella communis]|uniref:Outer membrane efflux protein n=1 Tax=Prevotella communis TaxID=2913614 RepID=A0A1H0ICE5_9BACT|nr:TolC family protein [Prevotella communis]SDO29035.1 Outer membrane efflux protein [Prevotella communis]